MTLRLPRLRRDESIIAGTAASLKHQKDWQLVVEAIEATDGRLTSVANALGQVLNGFNSRTITTSTTLLTSDYLVLVDASGGAVTVSLPAANSSDGQAFVIKKIDATANAVTIDANGSELIDGSTTAVISVQYTALMIICDGSAWWIA